jgi:transposase-like protein
MANSITRSEDLRSSQVPKWLSKLRRRGSGEPDPQEERDVETDATYLSRLDRLLRPSAPISSQGGEGTQPSKSASNDERVIDPRRG